MRAWRKVHPRHVQMTCTACGGGGGYVAGWGPTKLRQPGAVIILGLALLIVAVFTALTIRDTRRRLKIMQLIQRGVATNDEGLLETAYLEMMLLEPPAKRRSGQAEREDQAPRPDEG